MDGIPLAFLPILHHALLVYSPLVYQFICESGGFDLEAKSDFRFVENAYRLLLNSFDYKSQITVQQFFTNGFAEMKIIFCVEVIRLVKSKHKVLIAL
mmetsp:Transcript_1939/g.3352  ORF Transcript_1939/g.3352 Transcript_1939/m.3352 type:complete len:97 (+) Transcript_1939:115-405(+)